MIDEPQHSQEQSKSELFNFFGREHSEDAMDQQRKKCGPST